MRLKTRPAKRSTASHKPRSSIVWATRMNVLVKFSLAIKMQLFAMLFRCKRLPNNVAYQS